MTRKSGKHLYATYGALNSCFDLIRFHQQGTPWSHHWRSNQQPQYAETETLLLGHRFMPHIIDAELTSHGELRDHFDLMCLEGTYSLTEGMATPGATSSRCALLMRPNKVETALRNSVRRM